MKLVKQAYCAGCRSRPIPKKLHRWAKSSHSAKSPSLLNQKCDLDALRDLESPKKL